MGPTTGDVTTKAESLCDYLIGTANAMPNWVHCDIQEAERLAEFDQLACECAACGWWCEMGEANENPDASEDDICNDCIGAC